MINAQLKIGDYVFVSHWMDGDPNDPWYVSSLTDICENSLGIYYKVEGSNRHWRHCKKITAKRGLKIISTYPKRESLYNSH